MHLCFRNTDESCLVAANRKITVVLSGAEKETEKIDNDFRDSITTVRTGFNSGNQAPYLFFGKRK